MFSHLFPQLVLRMKTARLILMIYLRLMSLVMFHRTDSPLKPLKIRQKFFTRAAIGRSQVFELTEIQTMRAAGSVLAVLKLTSVTSEILSVTFEQPTLTYPKHVHSAWEPRKPVNVGEIHPPISRQYNLLDINKSWDLILTWI